MRLSLDLGYILKRVIIGVLIALIVMFVKSQVFAATCSSSTLQSQYTINNSTWTNFTSSFSINNPTYAIRLNLTNSNIKNNMLYFSGNFTLESSLSGTINTNPSFTIRYGTSSSYLDISSYCSIYTSRVNYPDTLTTQWKTSFACSYTGTNSSANWLQIYIYTNNRFINKFGYSDLCLQISPNSTDQIINNDNQNAINIANDMYNYYSSLWDKSNVQEEVILAAIENLNDNISDMISDIADSVQDAADSINDNLNDANITIVGTDIADALGDPAGSDFGLTSFIDYMKYFIEHLNPNNYLCSPLEFELYGNTISLPCGDTLFWTRNFKYDLNGNERLYSNVHHMSYQDLNLLRDQFRAVWNYLFGGALLYLLLWKLYLTVQDAIDPMTDNLEDINSAISVKDKSMKV